MSISDTYSRIIISLKDYTVGYNVKLALNRYDLTEEEKNERVDYILDMLGILKYKKKVVSKLSGGQRSRVYQ